LTVAVGDTLGEEMAASGNNGGDVRCYKMSKSYDKTTALKELTLIMKPNRILALLGQNGAGKSTTVNCMIGQVPITHGGAFAFGKSVRSDFKAVQAMTGVVPQHDILFTGLSGYQHLAFWLRFSGVDRGGGVLQRAAEHKLEEVNLHHDSAGLAMAYSGGMKRRLSVAIAGAREPRILFMDEPTTGMDPLSRRRVWAMIRRLKRDRVICLTTHSMEEADALGDDVAILAGGRLRAVGTPFFLKSRFGAGHQIALLADTIHTAAVSEMAKRLLPGSQVVAASAGSITVGVSHKLMKVVPSFFRHLEDKEEDQHNVKEWGVSNSTLEEVFLRLAVADKTVNALGAFQGTADAEGGVGGGGDESAVECVVRASGDKVTFFDKEGAAVTFEPVAVMSALTGRSVVPDDAGSLMRYWPLSQDDDDDVETGMGGESKAASAQGEARDDRAGDDGSDVGDGDGENASLLGDVVAADVTDDNTKDAAVDEEGAGAGLKQPLSTHLSVRESATEEVLDETKEAVLADSPPSALSEDGQRRQAVNAAMRVYWREGPSASKQVRALILARCTVQKRYPKTIACRCCMLFLILLIMIIAGLLTGMTSGLAGMVSGMLGGGAAEVDTENHKCEYLGKARPPGEALYTHIDFK
jgi:ABC-type multidrug transport system ATPase subunit